MLSLKDFNDTMETISDYYEKDQLLTDILETEGFVAYSSHVISAITLCLEEIFNDHENKWIEYWLWECDLGKDSKDKCFRSDESEIDISSIEKLYYFLLENMNECADE